MNYYILISNGEDEPRLILVSEDTLIAVEPGDDVVVMDENGQPVDVSLRPDGSNLLIHFEDGKEATLADFYEHGEGEDAITVSLNPVEPEGEVYEFNGQTGNLPGVGSFTLMRYSSTNFVDFLDGFQDYGIPSLLGGGGGGGSSDPADYSGLGGSNDIADEKPPVAHADSGVGDAGGDPIHVNVLSNDVDGMGDGLGVFAVGGVAIRSGDSVTLPSGTVVTLRPDGSLDVHPGPGFDALQTGQSGTETFSYTIRDAGGNVSTSRVTVTVNGVNDIPVANPDEGTTDQDAPVTVDVLANDFDPDTVDTLTVTGVYTPPAGDVVINGDNTISFDPNGEFDYLGAGESATVTLTYVVSDDSGETATSTVTFTVQGQNDGPLANPDADATDEDSSIVIDAVANDTDADGDMLSITGVDQPAKGSVSVNASNQLVFDPGEDFQSLAAGEQETVTFDYTITDGNGATDTATVTVTVTGVDDASVLAPDSAGTDEGSPVTIDVLNNDIDIDDTLTIAAVSAPTKGTVTNNGTDVTFDPGTDFEDLGVGESETVTFTYTTNTGASETVTITVTGTNDGPVAVNDADSTEENTSIVIDVVGNDSDIDGDALTVVGVDQPASGSVTINGSNQLVFDTGSDFDYLNDGESETVTFDYTISDGNGATDTAMVTVTVNGVDDASILAPDTGITDEETPVTVDVLDNDSDVDDALTVTGVSTPSKGSVTINGTDVTFDPGTDFQDLGVGESETVTFTYTTNTGASETVTITVTGTNDGPVAVNDADSTEENTSIVIDVVGNDSDIDGDALTVVGVDQPSSGSVTINGSNQIVFNPDSDFDYLNDGESATVTFDYTISDGNGATDTATVTVTVNGSDDASVLAPDTANTDEGSPVTIDVLNNDSDVDDTLTIAGVSMPSKGTVTNNGTDVTFDPGSDFENLGVGESETVTFTYTTNTGASESVTVTVTGTNDGPVAVNDASSASENNSVVIDAIANDTDVDGDDLTIVGVDQPTWGSVVINSSNQLVFDPGTDFDYLNDGESATVTFDYTISDGNGATDVATVTVTVNGADDASILAPDAGTTDEETPVTIDVLTNDSDADDTLSVTGVSTPSKGSASTDGTSVTFDPGSDFQELGVGESETVSFTYTTNTGATETVTVTVTGTNDGPVANDDFATTDESTNIVVSSLSNDADIDGDGLMVTGYDQPSLGSVSLNASNQFVFNPGNDFAFLDAGESATVTFDYTVSDGHGGTDTATVTVTVTGIAQPTVTASDMVQTGENTPVAIDVLDNDVDPDTTLAVASFTQPPAGQGSVSQVGNSLVFDPGTDFDSLASGESATVTFTYTTNSGATENVTVTVTGTDDATVSQPDHAVTGENTPVEIDVLGNDVDVDTALSIASVTQPASGSVTHDGSKVTFDPGTDFDSLGAGESATVTFTYTTNTGETEDVTVTINGVDDATITSPDIAVTGENDSVSIDVLGNDSDVDDTLSVASVTQPSLGSVTNNGSDVSFDPGTDFDYLPAGESATVTFTYTTNTGKTETVTVTVNGVDDASVTSPDNATTNENTPIDIAVLGNDVDVDTTLSIASVTQPASGSVTHDGAKVTFDPGSDFDSLAAGESATVTFTYTTNTGKTENVTVTVNGVDDATMTSPDDATTTENATVDIAVLGNDVDVDDALIISSVTQPASGSVTHDGTKVTFDPGTDFDSLAPGESATVTFTYTTSTGNTENVTVTINGVDDATMTSPDDATTTENATVDIAVLGNDVDVDDALIISSVTQPASGSVTHDGTKVTFDPGTDFDSLAPGESATVTFTYTTNTGNTENVTVTINGVDDITVTSPDAAATTENSTVDIAVLGNDTDVDDVLSISSVTQPGSGSVTHDGTKVTFDPGTDFDFLAAGESATVTFTYTTNTGETENVTVTINGVDDSTITNPDAAATGENDSVDIDVLGNDVDVDSALSIASVTQPSLGSVANNGTNVTFDPGTDFDFLAAGESATVTFTYTTNTGETENVTVTINGVDDSTITNPDAAATGENDSVNIGVLGNDSDVDDSLSIASVTQPVLGSVTNNGTDVTFDPGTDFDYLDSGESATVTFTYTTSTGETENVTVTVNGVEDATVTSPDVATTTEDATVDIAVLGNDSDVDDALSIASVTQPSAGSVTHDGTKVTFDPGTDFDSLAAGENATVAFTYTTNTGNTENVTVTVTGVDDATVTNPDTASTDADKTVDVSVLVNDADPDTALSIASFTQPPAGQGSVVQVGDDLRFDPGVDFNYLALGETTTVTFAYTTNTGETENVTVTVTGVSDPTVTAPDSGSTGENTPVDISVLANDTDIDSVLSIASVTQPASGSVTHDGSKVTFDPGTDFDSLNSGESATVTFTYTTNTGSTETVTVTVNGVDDATVTNPDNASTTENAAIAISVLGNDVDVDDALSIASVTQPSSGSVTHDGTDVTFDPGSDFDYLDSGESATVTFSYTTNTGETETVTVTVNGVDDMLMAAPDSASTDEDTPIVIDVLANDSELDASDNPLTVTSTTSPAQGSVSTDGSTVSFDPGSDFQDLKVGESATVTFSYTVTNQAGETDVEVVTVTVNGVNDAPDTHADTLHTIEGVGRAINVVQNDQDVEGSQLTVTEINGVSLQANVPLALSSGALVTLMEDGRVYFNPNGVYANLEYGETATISFSYTVQDEDGGTSTENVSVVIDGVDNDVVVAGAYQVLYNQLNEIQLDPTDESISYVPIGDPLPFNFNSIAYNANDGLIYANAQGSDAGLGINQGDIIRINPFTGEIVGNLGQFTNDQGETIPSYAGGINSDLNVYYVNGPTDSNGNNAYAIDLDTLTVTPIGNLPGADFGVDPNTGLIWSVNGTNSYSLDPTSGTLTTYSHGGLQIDGSSPATGTWGSLFSDGDGNIQVTSNSGYGLYRLDTDTGQLVRIGDAPATNSNDATGSLLSALPSAQPFIFLDVDGSTGATTQNDAVRVYDPNGSAVSISDSDTRIADLDGNTISSAQIVLKNPVTGDQLVIGALPGGITSSTQMVGGYLVITLTGNASQTDYEDAIKAISFENDGSGAGITDPREISVTITDVDGVVSNTATSLIFIGTSSGSTVGALDGQTGDEAYADSLVVMEDDNDPSTGGATLNLLTNDSDDPASITGLTQPPAGQGTVTDNGDGTVTFNPGNDFQYLSTGETAITTFSYTTSTGESEVVTVTVHGVDDPISAAPDSASGSEWNSIVIDVLANDQDPDAGDSPLTISSLTQPSKGSVSTDGSIVTFDPGSDFNYLDGGETEIVTFIYTVTNTRGEVENELVTVTVTGVDEPNAAPTVSSTPTSGTVYEAGLASGTGMGPTTTSISGVLSLADTDGDALTVRVDGADIGVIDGNASTVLGSVMGEDGNGQLTIFGDGSWTYQLLNDAVNDSDDATFIDSEREDFSITVFDGVDSSAPVNLVFNIVDDNVVLGTPSDGSLINSPSSSYTGTLGVTGADSDMASLTDAITGWDGTTTTFEATTQTSGGNTVFYYVDPSDTSVLIAYTDTSGSPSAYNASNPDQAVVFTLDVDPATNSYEITMTGSIDNFESATIDFSMLSASGPQDNYRFTNGPSLLAPGDPVPAGETVIFTAYGTEPGSKVNSNNSYLGIGNNLVNPGEGAVAIDVEKSGNAVVIGYSFNGGGSNTTISWTAYAPDDVTVLGTGTFDATTSSGTFSVEWMGEQMGKVEIEPLDDSTKSFRISSIFVDGIESETPLDLSFPVTVTDQDGDSASTSIGVELTHSVTPIVVDLDGDGVEFDGVQDGIDYDVDGDGVAEHSAWADEDDAVLVYDENHNGRVDGIHEVALSHYSDDPDATDLDGLRTFDSNGDNILDANDEDFDKFLLWQDGNGDGIVDDDELFSLSDAGIDGLELVSDNSPHTDADGDVLVHGQGTVHYSDGTTGIFADAEFEYIELDDGEAPLEVVDDNGNVVSLEDASGADHAPDPSLIEHAAPEPMPEHPHADAGAMPETSIEDDAAAAGAHMS